MPETEQRIWQIGEERHEAVQHVIFELPGNRTVSLSQETGDRYQLPGVDPVWVARDSEGGLRPSIDPETALSRFVSDSRAERMAGAMFAFIQDGPVQ